MNPDNPLTIRRMAAIKDVLRGPATTLAGVAESVHLCPECTRRYLRHLHAIGVIYIAAWRKARTTRITYVPAYRIGAGADVPKPDRMTPAQRTAAYRARIRSDAELHDRYKAKGRAQKRKPARDALVGALFGAARAAEVPNA